MVQWLRLFVFTTEVLRSISGQGTQIPASHLACPPQKNIYQKKKKATIWIGHGSQFTKPCV